MNYRFRPKADIDEPQNSGKKKPAEAGSWYLLTGSSCFDQRLIQTNNPSAEPNNQAAARIGPSLDPG
jgi:hypothetical protein